MARQPKLILREGAIDDTIADWPAGSFLETGAGTGYKDWGDGLIATARKQ